MVLSNIVDFCGKKVLVDGEAAAQNSLKELR